MEIEPGERRRAPLSDAAAAVELEEPAEDVLAAFGIGRRLEERERITIAPTCKRSEMRAQWALVILEFFEAEGVAHIGS